MRIDKIVKLFVNFPHLELDDVSDRSCCEFVLFCGRVFGYLSAPGQDRIDQLTLRSARPDCSGTHSVG